MFNKLRKYGSSSAFLSRSLLSVYKIRETGSFFIVYFNSYSESLIMSAGNQTITTIYDVFNKHAICIDSSLEQLHEDLLFLKDGINLVVGESKSGKTYTTIKSLVDAGLKDYTIHVDFDRNADSKLSELGVVTYHIDDVSKLLTGLDELGEGLNDSLKGKILVIDSLQDLSLEDGLDSNHGSLQTMKRVLGFKDTGATIILIHHITLIGDDKPKIKGNSSVITSKCDTTISFTKTSNTQRSMKVLNTRAEDKIPSGTSKTYTSGSTRSGNTDVPA